MPRKKSRGSITYSVWARADLHRGRVLRKRRGSHGFFGLPWMARMPTPGNNRPSCARTSSPAPPDRRFDSVCPCARAPTTPSCARPARSCPFLQHAQNPLQCPCMPLRPISGRSPPVKYQYEQGSRRHGHITGRPEQPQLPRNRGEPRPRRGGLQKDPAPVLQTANGDPAPDTARYLGHTAPGQPSTDPRHSLRQRCRQRIRSPTAPFHWIGFHHRARVGRAEGCSSQDARPTPAWKPLSGSYRSHKHEPADTAIPTPS